MQNSSPPYHAIKVIIIFLPSLFVYSSYNSQRIWYRTTNSYASHLLCLFVMQCFLPIAEIPRKFKQMQQQNTKGLTLLQGEKQNTHKEWSQTINYQQWWGLWHCKLSTAVWSSGPILISRGQEKILPHKWWLKSRAQIVSRLDNNHFFEIARFTTWKGSHFLCKTKHIRWNQKHLLFTLLVQKSPCVNNNICSLLDCW